MGGNPTNIAIWPILKEHRRAVGQPAGFGAACAVIILWVVTGPIFGFSDTWQLIINTGTTIVTFLMVFLIQNTQNRDAEAMHIKLDELIRAIDKAQNALLNLEELEEKDLDRIRAHYVDLAKQSRSELRAASSGGAGQDSKRSVSQQPSFKMQG